MKTHKCDSHGPDSEPVSRRRTLQLIGVAAATVPLSSAWGCTGQGSEADGRIGSGLSNDGCPTPGSNAGTGGTMGTNASVAWASGGTAAMTALASYPDPFEAGPSTACSLTCAMILGPCHDDRAPEREDISEQQSGLPMRFGLRIVDEQCQPVSDADVDIWHCDTAGVYSSETNDSPAFCTGDHPDALSSRWFRGHRMTDPTGVAWFSSCFPGWYTGRAIHVHVTVRRSGRDGDEYLTTQLAFPPELIEELCGSHVDYVARGLPDTANTADGVFPADGLEAYTMETQRMPDGALLAWKTLVIRSSLSDEVCSEGGGPGGPGGMPPGGFPGDGGVPPGFPPGGFPGDGGVPPGFPGANGEPPPFGA